MSKQIKNLWTARITIADRFDPPTSEDEEWCGATEGDIRKAVASLIGKKLSLPSPLGGEVTIIEATEIEVEDVTTSKEYAENCEQEREHYRQEYFDALREERLGRP